MSDKQPRELTWEEAERQSRDDHAHITYVDMACPRCGRHRMEQLANGKVVCEKCSWEPAVNDFNYEHLSLNR